MSKLTCTRTGELTLKPAILGNITHFKNFFDEVPVWLSVEAFRQFRMYSSPFFMNCFCLHKTSAIMHAQIAQAVSYVVRVLHFSTGIFILELTCILSVLVQIHIFIFRHVWRISTGKVLYVLSIGRHVFVNLTYYQLKPYFTVCYKTLYFRNFTISMYMN